MKHTLRFTRVYMGALWRWYLGGILAILLTNYLSVQIPIRLAAGLDGLKLGSSAQQVIFHISIQIALLGILVIFIRTLSRTAFFTPARIAEYNLREAMFQKAMALQPDFYASHSTGDIISRSTNDITLVRAYAGFGTLQLFNVIGAVIITLLQMLAMSPLLTLTCIVPIVLVFFVFQLGIRTMMRLQREVQVLNGALAQSLLGTIQGVGTIQSFCVEQVFEEKLMKQSLELRRKNLRLAQLRAVLFPTLGLAGGVAIYGILAVGAPMALSGALSAGQLAAFISLSAYLLFPMLGLGFVMSVVQRAEASLERIHEVLDAPIDRPEEITGARPFPTPAQGPELVFQDLTLQYGDRAVLNRFSARIPAGSMVGIFGKTGSGKTTLLRVIARLINPEPGMVKVAGVDIRDLDLMDWRKRVTLVTQVPFLFSESIAENVAFGKEIQVLPALRLARMESDLETLPEREKTVVGERGIVLSGGQRQRVALARGLARESELLLLDDVLSAVDHKTETELIANLEARAQGSSTILLVSHRMSVLEKCDVVLVMEEGKVVDSGTHLELIARPGLYLNAWLAASEEEAA